MAVYGIEPTEAEELALVANYAGAYASDPSAVATTQWAGPNAAPTLADAERFYQGDISDSGEFSGYWDLYGDPPDDASWWIKDDQLTPEASQWFLNAQTGGEAERQRQAAADDDDLLGDLGGLLLVAALVYTGGAAAGWWGAAEGAAAAGAAGAAEAAGGGLATELAFGAPELAGAYSLSAGTGAGALSAELAAGAPSTAAAVTAPAVAAADTIPELGLIANEATAAQAISQGIPAGMLEANFAGNTVGAWPADGANYGYETPAPKSGGSLVDKAINWAGKEIGKELLGDVLSPDAPVIPGAAAGDAARPPFEFFGGLPWRARAGSGAPGLRRLSTGNPVYGSQGLMPPSIIHSRIRGG